LEQTNKQTNKQTNNQSINQSTKGFKFCTTQMTTRSRDYASTNPEQHHPQPVEQPNDDILEKDVDGSPSSSSSQTPSSTSEDLQQLNRNHDIVRDNDNVNNTLDLEKQDTAQTNSGNQVRQRISRVKTAINGVDHQFTHPLAHVKTAEDVIVDFDVRIYAILITLFLRDSWRTGQMVQECQMLMEE